MKIGIIDYEMGNLGSVLNACRFLDLPAEIIDRPAQMEDCSAIVLPGVGAFGDCMEHLQKHGFVEPVRKWIEKDKPFLGICLGFQVLFESSEESPGVPGMGVFPGVVRKFNPENNLKVPQMGWNRVWQKQDNCPFFDNVEDGSFFYFVHSFYVDTSATGLVAGVTEYGIAYTSAVARGNAMAVQFHPEKSQEGGLEILKNFGRLAKSEY